jgi:3-phosphoshikimate 1-carboxyvinyltransferase
MGLSLTFPEKLRATITLPGSKSIAARALILSALSGGRQVLNLSDCDDTQALLKALTHDTEIVDIGAAGTAMRFLTAYFATQSGTPHLLTGTERMQQRPISILVEALQTLGADITYTGQLGYPPLLIKGKDIQGGEVRLSAEVSSQYI